MSEKKRIFIGGTGKSGISAADMALGMGNDVLLYNSSPDTDKEAVLKHWPDQKDRVLLVTGELQKEQLEDVGLAVLSPGIPLTVPFVSVLKEAGIPVIGELELAYRGAKGLLAAITGTNGKTTTTALVGEILKTSYQDVHVVGNIGDPYAEEALSTTAASATVVEVSSFMLETIDTFRPHVSAILNITPDHLDRHLTMENYIRVKEHIACNQTEDDYVVLNYLDPALRSFGMSGDLKAKVVWFSSEEKPETECFWLSGDDIMYFDGKTDCRLINVHELQLLGKHNFENVMAGAAVAMKMGVSMEKITEALKRFQAVEHRIEFVREYEGVKYYNDSKGTNPDAAIQALKAMPGPTILIGGGYDKHNEFDDWVKMFPGKVKKLILIGQTRDKIRDCCEAYHFTDYTYAESLEEAVKLCRENAAAGDYVLLSPACASWGMFKNFEQRGEIFKDLVRAL